MEKIVIGTNITKSYKHSNESTKALNDVNIEIAKGEFVAIMGPSGGGKSTLLFALSGTDAINDGSITFDGEELSKQSENALADVRRKKMGFVFQQPTMLKNLNILDNIVLPAFADRKAPQNIIAKKAKALMEKTEISGLEKRDITEVSGGQLQRAGICRALINEPEILFADEPTGALNSKAADDIMDLLLEIHGEGMAILLVTHDSKVAARAQRVLFMRNGQIVSETIFDEYKEKDLINRMEQIIFRLKEFES